MSKIPKHSIIDLGAVAKAIEESQTNLEAMSAAYTKILRTDLEAVARVTEESRINLEAMSTVYTKMLGTDLDPVARVTEESRINLEAMSTVYTKMLGTDLEAVAGAFEQSRISLEALSTAYAKIPRIDLDAVGKAFEQSRIRLEPMSVAYAEISRNDLDAVGRSFGKNFGIDPDAMRTALDQIRIDLGRKPFGEDFGIDLDAMRTAFDKNFNINLEALRQSVAAAYGRHPNDLKSLRELPVHDSGRTDVEDLDASRPSPSAAQDQAQDAKSATTRRMQTAWQLLGTLSLIDDLFLGGTAKPALREAVGQSVTRIAAEFLVVLSLLAPAPSSSPIPTGPGPEAKNESEHIADKVVSEHDVVGEASVPPREKDR